MYETESRVCLSFAKVRPSNEESLGCALQLESPPSFAFLFGSFYKLVLCSQSSFLERPQFHLTNFYCLLYNNLRIVFAKESLQKRRG